MKNIINRKDLKYYLPVAVAFVLITSLGIYYDQAFIKLLPAWVTLCVNLLTAKVNRICFLIGATNCIIYSIGYFQEGLYGSVGSALLYSMPLQLVSYFTWRKNKRGSARNIKALSVFGKIAVVVSIIASSALAAFILSNMKGSSNNLLDGSLFVLGLFATVFIMFGYIEGMIVNVISISLGLYMWITIVASGKIENITYVILSLYNLYMITLSLINWIKLYKKQRAEIKGKTI
jgi:nicotinamide mononucleotide transporter